MSFARFNRGSSFQRFSQPSEPYDTTSLERQIENANLRIEDAGYKPEKTDKRNWFEKLTNLPKGQNFFFDALELIGRPGQAVMNVLDKGTEIGVGNALSRGFAGQDRVRGSDLLDNSGINNRLAKTILGTGLEIALDPTTYIPGAQIAKVGQLGAKGVKTGASAVYNAVETAVPSFGRFSQNQLRPAAESVKEGLGYMFKPDYKKTETLTGESSDFLKNIERETENSRNFMKENYMRDLSDTAKSAGGIDTGLDVGRIMESPLRQFEDVRMYEFPDGIRKTTSKRELRNEIIGNQQRVKELGGIVRDSRSEIDKRIGQAAKNLEKLDNQIRRAYFSRENAEFRKLNKGKTATENINELAQNKAFEAVGASPAFNLLLKQRDEVKGELDNLRKVKESVGESEINNINRLVDENEAIRESMRNPVSVQREIPRTERTISDDADIQNAAKQLVDSNDAIRSFAAEKGIDIPELAGYMTHILTQEEKTRRSAGKAFKIDSGSSGTGNPSKKILQQRKLTGSVEDINEQIGRNFFETNAYFATGVGQQRLIDYIHAVDFRRKVLSNKDFAQPYVKGMDIGKNVVIDSNNYKFLKDSGDALEGMDLADKVGGEYVVTPQVKMLLDRYQRINSDEGTKAFIKAFDGLQSTWKKLALFSPGFHIRNMAGGMWNNYATGMNLPQIVKYTSEGAKEVIEAARGKESELFKEYRAQGLGSTGLSQVEYGSIREPEKGIRKTIENRSKDTKGKVLQRANPLNAFQTSREVGDIVDQTNRFAVYKWARDKGMSPEQAASKVRETQFDYTNLTQFEQKARRLIPFYAWMRNNIPFQVKKFIEDPRKFQNINRLRLNAQENVGLDDDNMPSYMKESFSMPIFGEDGKGKMLGLNLPLGDLTKLSNPLKLGADALTPLIKTPLELATNFNFFRGKPIEQFEGQEKQFIGGAGIPIRPAYALEQLTGQLGRGLSDYLQKPENEDQDNKFRAPSFGINSLFKDFDADANAYFEKLNELKQLQDFLRYIEQQTGEKPRTVREIAKGQ